MGVGATRGVDTANFMGILSLSPFRNRSIDQFEGFSRLVIFEDLVFLWPITGLLWIKCESANKRLYFTPVFAGSENENKKNKPKNGHENKKFYIFSPAKKVGK